LVDGVADDAVDRANGHGDMEEIAAKFMDAAIGTVADEGQAEDGLLEPILGYGRMEEYLVIGDGRREGVVQGGLSTVALLIDKLSADACVASQAGDRLVS